MDLLDFDGNGLYFDEPLSGEVTELMERAADRYGRDESELLLLRAHLLAPDSLTVLVGLYRYYYYCHRLNDALVVAGNTRRVAGRVLGFPEQWQELNHGYLSTGAFRSIGLLRFYLLALKAEGYVLLRLGRIEAGLEALQKVRQMDEHDRLGSGVLLEVIAAHSGSDQQERATAASR